MTDLNALLPRELNYGESPEMTAIQSALSAVMGDVWAARDGFAAQLSPATATWGIGKWEEALGLVSPDRTSLDARRRAVIAKLRGAGTSTVERIRSVAEAQLGGVVWVLEYADEYRVEIWVRDMTASDGGFQALTGALKEIMPSHLRWSYGVKFIPAPFVNDPDEFTLHRFVMALAFSNKRNFPPDIVFDGSVLFDGAETFCHGQNSMFAFPRFEVSGAMPGLRGKLEQSGAAFSFALFRAAEHVDLPEFRARFSSAGTGAELSVPHFTAAGAMAKNTQSLSRAALTVDNLHTFGGEYSFDGSRRFDANKTQEEL